MDDSIIEKENLVSFLLGKRYNVERRTIHWWYPRGEADVERGAEEYALPHMNQSSLEEVEQVYENESEAESGVGVPEENSSLPEATGETSASTTYRTSSSLAIQRKCLPAEVRTPMCLSRRKWSAKFYSKRYVG